MAGVLTFAAVIIAVVVLLPARHELSPTARTVLPWVLGLSVLVALRFTVPGSRLEPAARRRRDRRRLGALGGALAALLLLGGIATTFQLRSWADVLVFGSLLMVAAGLGVMLNTHFGWSHDVRQRSGE